MTPKVLLFSLIGMLLYVACTPTGVPVYTESPPLPVVTKDLLSIDLEAVRQVQLQPFSEVYQVAKPPVYLVEKMALEEAAVVPPPPVENQPVLADQIIQMQVNPAKFDLSMFRFDRTVTFTTNYTYIAVPIAYEPVYDFSAGVMAGLIGDVNGAYIGSPNSFEVWFYENRVSLYDSNGNEVYVAYAGEPGSTFFWEQQPDIYVAEPLPYFVRNGCWLCWSLDGRCGCLVCK